MLVNYYYSSPTAYTQVTEKITRKRDTIRVRYGDEVIEHVTAEGDLGPIQQRWVDDVIERKNGLCRVTIEDPVGPIAIRWDSDLALTREPGEYERRNLRYRK